MKVLHLSGAMYWGGNEQQLADLIQNTKKFHVENTIFCFRNSPIENYAIRYKINYISIKKTSLFSLYLLRKLAGYVKEKAIAVIHIHTSNFVTAYMLADIIYKMRTPTVFSKKGISDKSGFLSPLKYNYKGIGRIICVSEGVQEAFKKVLKKKNRRKLTVIYDGIMISDTEIPAQKNLRRLLNIKKDVFLIGNIANHSQSKDLGVFVKTAHYLIHTLKRTDVHFIQIGRMSKFTKEFTGLVEKYQLRNHISFMGFMEDARHYIPQFTICLITSKTEGLPLVIYESFLKKVPVVSTVAGGIAEVIAHNENGFLADIGDYKSLARHLNTLLDDNALQQKFTVNSYKKLLAEYDACKSAEHTYNLYCTMHDENY